MTADNPVDWASALAVLGTGLLVGLAILWRAFSGARGGAKAGTAVLEARDLAGKGDSLIRQLRELEDTATKRTPEQLARERYALELDAARALLALEEKGGSPMKSTAPGMSASEVTDPSTPPARAPARDRASLRGFFWGVGSAAGVLLLGFFVYQSARPREAGGSLTGNLPAASNASSGEAQDGQEAQLKAAVAQDPASVEGHLALARVYVEKQDWMGVWNETARVLERAPGNPAALAYQSLVRLAMGQTDVAVDNLTKAIATDPGLLDSYAYLALAYTRMGRARDADATIAKAAKRFPERAADLRQYLATIKERESSIEQASTSSTGEAANPHAALKTPGDGAVPKTRRDGAAQQPRASTMRRVAGTVDVDPSIRGKLPAGGILFVFARPAGGNDGPPIAVKRLPAQFPATFELSEADSMMGQPLPDQLLIEARLDEDGDPTTRPPTDPKARLDGVKVGRTDLRLLLRRP